MSEYKSGVHKYCGDTDVYREYNEKTRNYSKEKWANINDGLMDIFGEFAACKNSGLGASSFEVQALVIKLQSYITANYYTCTNEILAGLGQMYLADERFKENIDKYGDGTAEFVAKAIEIRKDILEREDPYLEKYWGERKYKRLQCQLKKQEFSTKEKSKMSMEAINYIKEKGYVLYHDFMDDISESHPDWFNMLTFDKKNNRAILIYIKDVSKRRK